MVYSIWYILYAIFYMVYSICYIVNGIFYMVYSIWYILYAIFYIYIVNGIISNLQSLLPEVE